MLKATISCPNAISFLLQPLLAFIDTDELAFPDRMLLRLAFDLLNLCVGRRLEVLDVERVELEVVMVRPVALRRAGAAVPGLAEPVDRLAPNRLARPQGAARVGNVVGTPMAEQSAR